MLVENVRPNVPAVVKTTFVQIATKLPSKYPPPRCWHLANRKIKKEGAQRFGRQERGPYSGINGAARTTFYSRQSMKIAVHPYTKPPQAAKAPPAKVSPTTANPGQCQSMEEYNNYTSPPPHRAQPDLAPTPAPYPTES